MKSTACKLLLMAMAWIGSMDVRAEGVMPGTYMTELGTLRVGKPGGTGNARFEINSISVSKDTCQVEGTLRGTRATAEPADQGTAEPADKNCVIDILPKNSWLQVSVPEAAKQACRGFCGRRAEFEGEYFEEVPLCRTADISKKRSQFSERYKGKDYQIAATTLAWLMEDCGRLLGRRAEAEVRNDMAVVYRNMDEAGACLEALKPLKKDFIDEPGMSFSAADETWGKRMVSASRFNWKACGGK